MNNFKVELSDNAIFKTTLFVRISDLNYGNHLGHDSLISLLHEARSQFLKNYGYTELNIEGTNLLITDLTVNYLKEALYSDKLDILIGFTNTSKLKLILTYQIIKNSNMEIAKACTTLIFYDYKTKKISKIPQLFLKKLSESENFRFLHSLSDSNTI